MFWLLYLVPENVLCWCFTCPQRFRDLANYNITCDLVTRFHVNGVCVCACEKVIVLEQLEIHKPTLHEDFEQKESL